MHIKSNFFFFLHQGNRWKRQRLQHDLMINAIDESTIECEEYDEYYPMVTAEAFKIDQTRKYGRTIHLKGPCSPLETQVHSILLDSDLNSITIDTHSVNSVFITSMEQVQFRTNTEITLMVSFVSSCI